MNRAKNRQEGKGGLEILEEAAHCFRSATAGTLATYYVGTVPFVLSLLYFWTDMSTSRFAARHLVEGSLIVTALFFWMKFWQASFAARIRAELAMQEPPKWGWRGSIRVLIPQMVIHSTGLFILPISLLLLLPFGWMYAFYQNATALADPENVQTRPLLKRAWKQASLWILQNHTALGIGLLFGFCILLNWTLVAFIAPGLLRTFIGVETTFSRNPAAMANLTSLGIFVGLAYLSVDPILKAIYILRCFYGESLESGEDLKAELRRYEGPRRIAVMLALAIGIAFCGSLHAAQTQPAPKTEEVSPAQLDQQIDEVLRQSKYAWRLPNQKPETEKGLITRFFERVLEAIRDGINGVLEAIERLLRWIFRSSPGSRVGFGWMRSSLLLFVLIAVVAIALAVMLVRSRRRAAKAAKAPETAVAMHIPDIRDERVRADELPEDGWTTLARQLMESGEYRLAMRAYYLATLANLAQRNLVGIAYYKSNRDYQNELYRRAHAIPDLPGLFGENLLILERTWYGLHPADHEVVVQFAANVDRIRAAA